MKNFQEITMRKWATLTVFLFTSAAVQDSDAYGQYSRGYQALPNAYPVQPPTVSPTSTHRRSVPSLQPRSANVHQTQTNVPWYQSLATERDHDFGTVATASKQSHVFEFKNMSDADLHLTSVKASCGCTKPTILTPVVRPGETARIETVFDTLKFHGSKSATVTVSVKKVGPVTHWGELQFSVKGSIRQDIVLNPGEVRFDPVLSGKSANREIEIVYAGDAQWSIVDVKSSNPNIKAEFERTKRDEATRLTTYTLTVHLESDQPVGSLNEYLTLLTNDRVSTELPVHVVGRVKKGIDVAPVNLGNVFVDLNIEKRLILRGDQPFGIQSISSDVPGLSFEVSSDVKKLHIVGYRFRASDVRDVAGTITIKTSDLVQPEIPVPFSAKVLGAAMAEN